jgi:hypothetical protein
MLAQTTRRLIDRIAGPPDPRAAQGRPSALNRAALPVRRDDSRNLATFCSIAAASDH